ncbi:hypothetical protein LINGRAHAP2_LOCUS29383 [Linum grandiflorum]
MDDYRSKSYADARSSQLDLYYYSAPPSATAEGGMQDLRCYNASYAAASSVYPSQTSNQLDMYNPTAVEFKKGKSTNSSVSKGLELQRS